MGKELSTLYCSSIRQYSPKNGEEGEREGGKKKGKGIDSLQQNRWKFCHISTGQKGTFYTKLFQFDILMIRAWGHNRKKEEKKKGEGKKKTKVMSGTII